MPIIKAPTNPSKPRKAPTTGRKVELTPATVEAFISETFPTEEDRYEFLEKLAVMSAVDAQKVFQAQVKNMTAMEAARAYGIFMDHAVNIRKARLADFKEPAINITLLTNLERTLNALEIKSQPPAIDI